MIVLSTLNAKYIHASFGLRYLYANLGDLKSSCRILEFDIQQKPIDVAEAILSNTPRIVGLGVYIWNAKETLELLKLLKRTAPETKLVLGGPEVSYELEGQEIINWADVVITGEADIAFREVCEKLLAGFKFENKIVAAALPSLEQLQLPYEYYSNADLQHRIIYVEASRGCPFTCEFCLSSLDIPVRQFAVDKFLESMQNLLDRGARHFKFVDRTFNLNLKTSSKILDFFFERYTPGMFLHFEMIPDRFPNALRDAVKRFPAGALQFEVGIQSFNEEVNIRIQRKQSLQKIEENLGYLKSETGVHVHADLIAGLPGETLASFAAGFDRLVALGPQEIQVGILKRLRGTPIGRHDDEWKMVYGMTPPYEILHNKLLDFFCMQRLRRFSRYWDLYANSGNFKKMLALLLNDVPSPFFSFLDFSAWLFGKTSRVHSISLINLRKFLFEYLVSARGLSTEEVAAAMLADERSATLAFRKEPGQIPARQAKHLAAANS